MSDQERLAGYLEVWRDACDRTVALARQLPEEKWHLPTDLAGWDVIDNLAHSAHLEAYLAGADHDEVDLPNDVTHVRNAVGVFTEQGVVARRGRDAATLADELEQAVAARYAAAQADPPSDGSAPPPRGFDALPWDTERLLRNRPLDIWMHLQDINRAVGRDADWDAPAAAHTIDYLGEALPIVLAKRVGASPGTSLAIALPDHRFAAEVGDDGRGRPVEGAAGTTLSMGREDFIVLAGGRRGPDRVDVRVEGDRGLADTVLDNLALTP